jgi:hypothetical protein
VKGGVEVKNLNFSEAENVAAIALEFGASKLFDKAYRSKHIEAAGGFPEFYQVAIHAAVALEKVANRKKIVWGETADWVITIQAYSNAILEAIAEETFWTDGLEKIASESISE